MYRFSGLFGQLVTVSRRRTSSSCASAQDPRPRVSRRHELGARAVRARPRRDHDAKVEPPGDAADAARGQRERRRRLPERAGRARPVLEGRRPGPAAARGPGARPRRPIFRHAGTACQRDSRAASRARSSRRPPGACSAAGLSGAPAAQRCKGAWRPCSTPWRTGSARGSASSCPTGRPQLRQHGLRSSSLFRSGPPTPPAGPSARARDPRPPLELRRAPRRCARPSRGPRTSSSGRARDTTGSGKSNWPPSSSPTSPRSASSGSRHASPSGAQPLAHPARRVDPLDPVVGRRRGDHLGDAPVDQLAVLEPRVVARAARVLEPVGPAERRAERLPVGARAAR